MATSDPVYRVEQQISLGGRLSRRCQSHPEGSSREPSRQVTNTRLPAAFAMRKGNEQGRNVAPLQPARRTESTPSTS
jgi:hypothetical protein